MFHGAVPVLTSYTIKPGRHTILNILDIAMKQRKMIVFVILVIFLYNNVVNVQGQGWISAQCDLFDPTMMNRVHGRINLYQRHGTPLVKVTGKIYGLTPGLHGFHVHTEGNFGNNCSNAGPHFNPFNQHHGSPTDSKRHVGDLGNVLANNWGIADVLIYDHIIRLQASTDLSILGRSIVVHARPDDLGRGGNEESLRTGNAGARLACCQIRSMFY